MVGGTFHTIPTVGILRGGSFFVPPGTLIAIKLLNDIDLSVTLADDYNVERLYPYLSRALGGQEDGFDITNQSVLKSMQALLTELTIF